MSLRIPQAYVGVVATEPQTGNLKVRRLYVDVLMQQGTTSILNESANSAMTLTDAAHFFIEDQLATSTLNLTQNAGYAVFNQDQDVTSNLTLSDVAFGAREIPLGTISVLSLSSFGGQAREGESIQTLNLVHIAAHFNLVADRSPAGNTLNLTQTVTTLSSLDSEHDLGLTQTLEYHYPAKPNVTQHIGFSQHVSTPYHMWVEEDLGLTQFIPTPLSPQFITHTLNLLQNSPIGGASNALTFTHNAVFSFSVTAFNTLELEHEHTVTGIFIRSMTDDLGIGHALTWLEDTPCGRKQYSPFQGENTIPNAVAAPDNTLQDPQGSVSDRFALYQPALGVRTDEVVLRAPELDNRDRNSYSRVTRDTRGGHLSVFSDPNWPKVRTLAITIIGLLETDVDNLQAFLLSTIGQNIGITDWEGRLWEGVITNPDERATQDGKGRWTISLEFEGEMLEVEQPGNEDGDGMTMAFTQSVTAVIV
jgi:hypothetical protein